ncbi:hypothetical protein CRG98_001776, partial [Punica granatum]
MGNGNLVDGVRRWFHRLSSSSSSSSSSSTKVNNSNRHGSPTAHHARSSIPITATCEGGGGDGKDELAVIVEDLPILALPLIKVPRRSYFTVGPMALDSQKKGTLETEFFTEYGEANRYQVQEVVGKGSYGVVGSAVDTHTGERVAIKKINDVFEHDYVATRWYRAPELCGSFFSK